VLKSKPRLRLTPALPVPAVASASSPFRRTRVKSEPSPRMEMRWPSPPSRSMDTPAMRCIDSARFWSGNLPMSSAKIASTCSVE